MSELRTQIESLAACLEESPDQVFETCVSTKLGVRTIKDSIHDAYTLPIEAYAYDTVFKCDEVLFHVADISNDYRKLFTSVLDSEDFVKECINIKISFNKDQDESDSNKTCLFVDEFSIKGAEAFLIKNIIG